MDDKILDTLYDFRYEGFGELSVDDFLLQTCQNLYSEHGNVQRFTFINLIKVCICHAHSLSISFLIYFLFNHIYN